MQLATIESLGAAWTGALTTLALRSLWPADQATALTPLDVAHALAVGTALGIATALANRRRARASPPVLGSE